MRNIHGSSAWLSSHLTATLCLLHAGTAMPPSSAPAGMLAPAATAAQAVPSQAFSPTSKWALRMQHMLDKALTGTDDNAGKAAAAGEDAVQQSTSEEYSSSNSMAVDAGATEDAQGRDQAITPVSQQEQQQQGEQALQAIRAEVGGSQVHAEPSASSVGTSQADCPGVPEVQSGGNSPRPCTGSDSQASHAAGSMQQMSASAQQAASALRESMEKLHRATDVMLSVRHSQQRSAAATPASPRRLQLPQAEGCSTSCCSSQLCSPGVHRPADGSPGTANSSSDNPLPSGVARCSTGGCLLEVAGAAVRSSTSSDCAGSIVPGSVNSSPQQSPCQLSAALDAPASHSAMQHTEQAQQLEQANNSEPSSPGMVSQQQQQQQQQQREQQEQGQQQRRQWQQHPTTQGNELVSHSVLPEQYARQQQEHHQQQQHKVQPQPGYAGEPEPPSQQGSPAHSNVSGSTSITQAEPQAEGPTLDCLMAEVQQLAALRQALKAEFVAMGHGNIAAAMGTLGLSQPQALQTAVQGQTAAAVMQSQPGQQQHQQREQPSSPKQQPVQQETRRSVTRNIAQQELCDSQNTHKAAADEIPRAAAPPASVTTCNSSSSSSSIQPLLGRQEGVRVSAEQRVRMLIQPPSPAGGAREQQQQHPQQPEQQIEEAVQTCTPRLVSNHAQCQQLQPEQHHAAYADDCIASLTGDAGGFASWVKRDAAAGAAAEFSLAPQQDVAASMAQEAEAANMSCGSMDSTAMHMSFSFGHGKQQQQPDGSHCASPLPLQQVAGTIQQQYTHLQSHVQDAQGHTGAQAYLQQQKLLEQHQQQTLQLMAQQPVNNLQPMHAAAAVAPLLHWNLLPAQAGAATTGIVAGVQAAAPASAMMGTPVPQQPLGQCGAGASPIVAAAAAAQAALVVQQSAAQATSSAASSRCASPSHHPAVVSKWISSSPSSNSSRQASPLPSPGRTAAGSSSVSAKAAAITKTVTAPGQATLSSGTAGGSSFLDKLSRQASAGKGGMRSARVSDTAGQPGTGTGAAAVAAPVNQGSYLAAALAARQRVEKEQAERQRIEAAAAAAKQAAARKMQQEQEAQRLEAARAAKQVAHVAIGSYTSQGEQQQQHSSPPRPSKPQTAAANSPAATSSSQASSRGRQATQPCPPPVQNSSPSPPRRIMRTSSGTMECASQQGLQTAGASRGSSGSSTPSRPASRIPSAPGTPPASKQTGPLPLLPPVREAAAAQPGQSLHGGGTGARPGCGVGSGAPAGVSQLCESFDSDFDHLERELEADEEFSSTAAAAGSGQHVRGSNGSVPPLVPWQAAIAAAAAAGGQQAMWDAVQAAAAAAVQKHASSAAVTAEQVASGKGHGSSTAPGSSSCTTDSRGTALRPPALHIPTPTAMSVSATPAAVSPAAAARAATSAKAKQPSGKVSPLPSRATAVASSKHHQQQTRVAADSTAKTSTGE
jgi:hypothetical protein